LEFLQECSGSGVCATLGCGDATVARGIRGSAGKGLGETDAREYSETLTFNSSTTPRPHQAQPVLPPRELMQKPAIQFKASWPHQVPELEAWVPLTESKKILLQGAPTPLPRLVTYYSPFPAPDQLRCACIIPSRVTMVWPVRRDNSDVRLVRHCLTTAGPPAVVAEREHPVCPSATGGFEERPCRLPPRQRLSLPVLRRLLGGALAP